VRNRLIGLEIHLLVRLPLEVAVSRPVTTEPEALVGENLHRDDEIRVVVDHVDGLLKDHAKGGEREVGGKLRDGLEHRQPQGAEPGVGLILWSHLAFQDAPSQTVLI